MSERNTMGPDEDPTGGWSRSEMPHYTPVSVASVAAHLGREPSELAGCSQAQLTHMASLSPQELDRIACEFSSGQFM